MEPTKQDYREMTRQELYGLAQERGIEGRSRLSKDQLVEALELDDIGPDAVSLLLEQHEDIRERFIRFEQLSARPSKKKQKLVQQIVSHVSRHTRLEEQVFYPAVRADLPDLRHEVDEHVEEHHVAELLSSELETMEPSAPRYDAKVAVLIESVRRHLDREEQQLFPHVVDEVEAVSRRELGATMLEAWGKVSAHPQVHVVLGSRTEAEAADLAARKETVAEAEAVLEAEAEVALEAEAGPEVTAGTAGDARSGGADPAGGALEAAPAGSLPSPEGSSAEPVGTADEEAGGGEAGDDMAGPEGMTRYEEELVVGTTTREAGRARLRKQVVTEHVAETVPVEREEAVVTREPITDADEVDEEPHLAEEELEVTLHEEEAVAEKRVVPKERVRIGTSTRTDQRVVSGDVAREDIEVEFADEGEQGDEGSAEDEVIDLTGHDIVRER